MHIGLKIFIWGVLGLVVFGALLFGPAGTFDYWQAWVFLAAFVSTTIGPTIYLARNDPAALQRRMRSGPLAEGRTIQKFIVIGAFLGFFAMMVLSACDHRYGWSSVPAAVCVIAGVMYSPARPDNRQFCEIWRSSECDLYWVRTQILRYRALTRFESTKSINR